VAFNSQAYLGIDPREMRIDVGEVYAHGLDVGEVMKAMITKGQASKRLYPFVNRSQKINIFTIFPGKSLRGIFWSIDKGGFFFDHNFLLQDLIFSFQGIHSFFQGLRISLAEKGNGENRDQEKRKSNFYIPFIHWNSPLKNTENKVATKSPGIA
jgi:hypothetical protein